MEIYGLIIGILIVAQLFAFVWMADKPADKEDDKTLMGALD